MKRVLRVLWIVAILVVVVASLLSSDSASMQLLATLPIGDKFEHLTAYVALAFLPAIHERRGFIIAAALGAIALGIALEYAQRYTGWRDYETGDMIADVIGVCIGAGLGLSMRPLANRLLFSAD